MITLKEALKYSKEELENLKKELNEKAKKEKKIEFSKRYLFK
ncbi:hypothetical protein [Campylobacter jejuni]|nr:hypothetical protein [Campylobacter jejuni]